MRYYLRLWDERSAQSRLEDILGSETRTAIARHELIEVVRTHKDRQPLQDESLTRPLIGEGTLGVLRPIHVGRVAIEKDVFDAAAPKLAEFGIVNCSTSASSALITISKCLNASTSG